MFESQIPIILFFQNLGEWLYLPMKAMTFLGEETFFFALVPIFYWLIDARLGFRIGLTLIISIAINGFFKLAFHMPRPYWYDTRVQALDTETSFGLPSGHSQNSAAIWGSLGFQMNNRTGWLIVALLVFLVGISRMYLGVHFVSDVLSGWLLGFLLVWVIHRYEQPVLRWFRRFSLAGQCLLVLGVSFSWLALGWIVLFPLQSWVAPATWIQNTQNTAEPLTGLEPLSLSGVVSAAGSFAGTILGLLFIGQKGAFRTAGTWQQLALRLVIGMIGVGIFWMGLGEIFPSGQDILSLSLRYVRYALAGGWITGLAPWVFWRFRLAERPDLLKTSA